MGEGRQVGEFAAKDSARQVGKKPGKIIDQTIKVKVFRYTPVTPYLRREMFSGTLYGVIASAPDRGPRIGLDQLIRLFRGNISPICSSTSSLNLASIREATSGETCSAMVSTTTARKGLK